MDFTGIITACILVGAVGLLIGVLLGVADRFLAVKEDERIIKIREALPGNNCGGCGYPGCDGLAAAIVKGNASVAGCPVGGDTAARVIGEIMGTSAKAVRRVAYIKCSGDCRKTNEKFKYSGNMTCMEASMVPGNGPKSCEYGCLGYGSCVSVCDNDAISIINGIAVVDKEKCTGCGRCAKECPKGLIEMAAYDSYYLVSCNSRDKGVEVKTVCSAGCIGCTLCTRDCPTDAVTVSDFLAHIDTEKCCGCGLCADKCPQKVIKEV